MDSLHASEAARDAYLNAATVAADEVEANFFVNMAQILRGYGEKQHPITGITMVGPLTVAQAKAGPALIPFALDQGVWTANADTLSQRLKRKRELQARGFTVVEPVGRRLDIVG